MTALLNLEIAEVLARLDDGSLQSETLLDNCLARIDQTNPTLNAFVRIDRDSARRTASGTERRDGALAGLPCAHKDMFSRAGLVSTYGSRGFANVRAEETATVLERLDAAGAIDLGTLHMAELAHGSTGHNLFLGHARNPWNPEHITGGSSSGPAVAVAARMVFAALGSDTGGSIRMPAHFCGVTGLKPTQGLVSRAGCMPLSFSLDSIAPMAASAAGVATVLEQIVGADPRDPTAEASEIVRYKEAVSDPVGGRTVGVPEAFYCDDLTPAVSEAMERTIALLERLGCKVVPVPMPVQEELSALQLVLVASEACSQHRDRLVTQPENFEPLIRSRMLNGFGYSAQDYLDALRNRGPALRAHLQAVDGIDALLTPVVAFEAPTLAETDVGGGPAGEQMTRRISRLMRPANYLGTPALAFPAGFSSCGLPVGLQLVGKPFCEDALFAFVGAIQRATDYHRQDPFG